MCWGRNATPFCCFAVQISPYLSVEDEDFRVGVLNLHMFCGSSVLAMVVAATAGLWLVVIWTFWFAHLKIRKDGHSVLGSVFSFIVISSISCEGTITDLVLLGCPSPCMTRGVSVLNCVYLVLYSFWTVTCCLFLFFFFFFSLDNLWLLEKNEHIKRCLGSNQFQVLPSPHPPITFCFGQSRWSWQS